MKNDKMKKVNFLYRDGKYSKWQQVSISVPKEIKNVREFCENDLQKMNINFKELQIIKIETI